jgi:uncharacterized protein YxjI
MSNTNSLLEIDNLILKRYGNIDIIKKIWKNRILSILHYDLEDRAGTKLGEAFLSGLSKFVVNDASGSEVMHIERAGMHAGLHVVIRDPFTFYDPAGEELGTMQRKLATFFGREEFWVEKDGVEFMRIYVDSSERNYKMQVRGFQVASAYKHMRAFRPEQLEISITGGVDRRAVIGAVIVIEFLNATTRISSSSE